jgi:Icc-related predicted phosphoesterase
MTTRATSLGTATHTDAYIYMKVVRVRPVLRAIARAASLVLCVATVVGVAACRSAPITAGGEPFFFIQMADPQFGFFTANQDFARETANFTRAIEAANRLHPAFVVVSGDLTHRAGDSAQIAEYRRIAATLDRSIPLYNVAGNHDLALPLSPASVAAYRRVFGPDYYRFERNGVLGLVINSSLIKEPSLAPVEAAAQSRWLETTLKDARLKRKRVIVFQHHPWFLARADEPEQYFNLPVDKRVEVLGLLHAAGVRQVFAGHYHRNALAHDGDLEMVTTGPVGKPLGIDPSGFRVVIVTRDSVMHRYYALDSVPERVAVPR